MYLNPWRNLGTFPSPVGIARRYQLHGPGSKPNFPHPSWPASEATQFTVQLVPGVKRPGRLLTLKYIWIRGYRKSTISFFGVSSLKQQTVPVRHTLPSKPYSVVQQPDVWRIWRTPSKNVTDFQRLGFGFWGKIKVTTVVQLTSTAAGSGRSLKLRYIAPKPRTDDTVMVCWIVFLTHRYIFTFCKSIIFRIFYRYYVWRC